ncbi:MAG: glycosyl transferase, group 1 [Acidimicrobiia bacterium]|nr:glycosyl transferase, group 1 [Acidimicrobiia bacterium]
MRVALSLEQLWHRVPGGTAVAALETARALLADSEIALVGVRAWHRGGPPEPWAIDLPWRTALMPRSAMYEAWLRLRRPRLRGIDLVHATTLVPPASRAPMVATVHDLAVIHEPEHFTARGVRTMTRGVEIIRDEASLVMCSSEATMADCRQYGFESSRLRLVPLGVRGPVAEPQPAATLKRLGLDRPYVLSVGTLEPRKNLARLVDAFASLPPDFDLVVVGPTGWGPDVQSLVEALGGRAKLCGFVDQATLWDLYAGAAVFCYPSLREGFGLPVLEAMAAGAPVVTSRGTATEEAAGGAAVLVDPLDVADIARGLHEAIAGGEALARAGRKVAAAATWARTAALTAAVYREVVGS